MNLSFQFGLQADCVSSTGLKSLNSLWDPAEPLLEINLSENLIREKRERKSRTFSYFNAISVERIAF